MINKALEARIENGTLLHAYIISGPKSQEKRDLTLKMAMSIVCSGRGKRPCMTCPNCRKAAEGIHPDIITVAKAADKKEILVDQIREISALAPVLPNDSSRKVYIIDGADLMNVRAQNTLLKVLEEPPTFVSFILLVENSGVLLETIRSRCVDIKLQSREDKREDSEALAEAERLLNAADGGTDLEICRILLDAEKLDRNVFPEFIADGYTEAIKRMKDFALRGKETQKYAEIAQIFKECRKYIEYNVGNGHICGILAAQLIELRGKK